MPERWTLLPPSLLFSKKQSLEVGKVGGVWSGRYGSTQTRGVGSDAHPDRVSRRANQVSRFCGNCSGQLVDMEVQPYVAGAGSHTSCGPLFAAWLTAAFSNRNRSIRPDRPLGSALMPFFSPAMALGDVNRHRFPLAGGSFSVQAVDTCSATYAL